MLQPNTRKQSKKILEKGLRAVQETVKKKEREKEREKRERKKKRNRREEKGREGERESVGGKFHNNEIR